MAQKLKQVTDSVHGTIYLSKLETELISTPYFYRLHDIYQNSTVYMTFPSNRTKRYEHSMGTMELASSMLFSATSNADKETRAALFEGLNEYFTMIYETILLRSQNITAPYYTMISQKLDTLLRPVGKSKDGNVGQIISKTMKEFILPAVKSDCFQDSALDRFQLFQIGDNAHEGDARNYFLYRSLMQAVRLVALFHDVGHPPYSHVIEEELVELYKDVTEKKNDGWNESRVSLFKERMEPFLSCEEKVAYRCQAIGVQGIAKGAHFHERVGFSLLQSAMNEEIPNIINEIADSKDKKKPKSQIAKVLYYIMVMEYTIAIFNESNIFFKSMHSIVDGVVDADRLDYIMRDSMNSGVDWGEVPYKRLIYSGKMVCLPKNSGESTSECTDDDANNNSENSPVNTIESSIDPERVDVLNKPFVIAYPFKLADDIIDILTLRYKIFTRINFHHRCIKTAVSLRLAVRDLAEDYLRGDDKSQCIESDISFLWNALGLGIGARSTRIIQWNDSGLITVLHRALVKLSEADDQTCNVALRENLEEILMNKKRYHALIKRGADSRKIVDKVFEHMGLDGRKLASLKEEEQNKYFVNRANKSKCGLLSKPEESAYEAIKRIDLLQKVLETGDMEMLDGILPASGKDEGSVKELIESALHDIKETKLIQDYKVIVNDARSNTGLPRHADVLDNIMLFFGENVFPLDEKKVLRPQIETLEKNTPWIFAYYVPLKKDVSEDELEEKIYESMAKTIGDNLAIRFAELFQNTNQLKTNT